MTKEQTCDKKIFLLLEEQSLDFKVYYPIIINAKFNIKTTEQHNKAYVYPNCAKNLVPNTA